jgi:hypothetical protein
MYFKVKIIKHTPLLFDNNYIDAWHKDKIDDMILVKEVDWISAFYETKNGSSILKNDCERISETKFIR